MRSSLALRAAVPFALLVVAAPAQAQTGAANFPNQLVRIVVPFSAGSQSDILGRAYADKLAQRWKKDVIIENKPGLAGVASVAKAPNDGHTLILVSNGHAIIPALNSNLNFDPVKDFAGVARLAIIPGIMVVPPESGLKTLADLIAMAKANPGTLNYASAGLGSASSIGVELMKIAAGIDLVHVPYRGLPEAHTSVMRNDTLVFMTYYSAGGELINAGKLRPMAVTTAKRLKNLPNVPTLAEAGLVGFSYDPWFGLLAPAGTPPDILDKISADVAAISKSPDMDTQFTNLGVDLSPTTPKELDVILKADNEKFMKIFGNAKQN